MAGETRLYWQAGTVSISGEGWKWKERFPIDWKKLTSGASSPLIIPVIRLEPAPGIGLPKKSFSELASVVGNIVTESGARELQIDYECPDRLIPNYLDFLQSLKESGRTWLLSISALGHWSKYADKFRGLTDEITPMFYDLNPQREKVQAGMLPPLADTSVCAQIQSWKGCTLPWLLGLPNFSRLSLVDAQGVNRGNFRRWSWDEFWFSSEFEPLSKSAAGETRFMVKSPGSMEDTPLKTGEMLVARYPDRDTLRIPRAHFL